MIRDNRFINWEIYFDWHLLLPTHFCPFSRNEFSFQFLKTKPYGSLQQVVGQKEQLNYLILFLISTFPWEIFLRFWPFYFFDILGGNLFSFFLSFAVSLSAKNKLNVFFAWCFCLHRVVSSDCQVGEKGC